MASKKGKRRGSKQEFTKNQQRNLSRQFGIKLNSVDKLAEASGIYRQRLLLQDESELRDLERRLPRTARKALRLYFLANMGGGYDEHSSYAEYVVRHERELFLNNFVAALCGILAEYQCCQEGGAPSTHAECEAAAQQMLSAVPKAFRCSKPNSTWGSLEGILSDPLSAAIFHAISWDGVLRGDNVTMWSKNAVKMISSALSDEALAALDNTRDRLILLIAGKVAELQTEAIKEGIAYLKKIAAMPKTPRQGRPLFPTGAQDELYDSDDEEHWDEPLCQVAGQRIQTDHDIVMRLYTSISEYNMAEVSYACITLAAAHRSITECPGIVHSLLTYMITVGYYYNERYYDFLPKFNAESVSINTSRACIMTEQMREAFARNEKEGKDDEERPLHYPNLNVSQMAHTYTEVVLPPVLRIGTGWVKSLEDFGFTHDESMLLCGFMEGSRCIKNSLAGASDEEEVEDDRFDIGFEDLDETTQKELLGRMRAEVQQEYKEDLAQAQKIRERAETVERQARRENRTSIYRAEQAEGRLGAIIEERDELRIQLERLMAENEELLNRVRGLGGDVPALEEEEPDAASIDRGPYDIGKDFRLIVFGGQASWVAEMKRRFPNIEFYDVDAMPREASIVGADVVLLYTFVMKHKVYYGIQEIAKRNGMQLHYLQHKGVNRVSEEILELYDKQFGGGERSNG